MQKIIFFCLMASCQTQMGDERLPSDPPSAPSNALWSCQLWNKSTPQGTLFLDGEEKQGSFSWELRDDLGMTQGEGVCRGEQMIFQGLPLSSQDGWVTWQGVTLSWRVEEFCYLASGQIPPTWLNFLWSRPEEGCYHRLSHLRNLSLKVFSSPEKTWILKSGWLSQETWIVRNHSWEWQPNSSWKISCEVNHDARKTP